MYMRPCSKLEMCVNSPLPCEAQGKWKKKPKKTPQKSLDFLFIHENFLLANFVLFAVTHSHFIRLQPTTSKWFFILRIWRNRKIIIFRVFSSCVLCVEIISTSVEIIAKFFNENEIQTILWSNFHVLCVIEGGVMHDRERKRTTKSLAQNHLSSPRYLSFTHDCLFRRQTMYSDNRAENEGKMCCRLKRNMK